MIIINKNQKFAISSSFFSFWIFVKIVCKIVFEIVVNGIIKNQDKNKYKVKNAKNQIDKADNIYKKFKIINL